MLLITWVSRYINLGVSDHPTVNPEQGLKYIDFAYLVCQGIEFISINNASIAVEDINLPSYYFGGMNMNPQDSINEFEIKSRKIHIQLLETSEVTNTSWSPIKVDVTSYNQVAEKDLMKFLNLENYPDNIKNVITW